MWIIQKLKKSCKAFFWLGHQIQLHHVGIAGQIGNLGYKFSRVVMREENRRWRFSRTHVFWETKQVPGRSTSLACVSLCERQSRSFVLFLITHWWWLTNCFHHILGWQLISSYWSILEQLVTNIYWDILNLLHQFTKSVKENFPKHI